MINAIIDPQKNFVTINEPGYDADNLTNVTDKRTGETISLKANKGSIRYIRWGWFEDNILSKYISMVGRNTKNPIMTFRSVEPPVIGGEVQRTRRESVKIADYYLVKCIDPSHSLIFKPGMFQDNTALDSRDVAVVYESFLGKINNQMLSTDNGPSRNFRVDTAPMDEKNANSLGYLRNIFINSEVIQKHFGISLTDMALEKSTSPFASEQYIYKGVTPKQNVRSSILGLMGEVSANFFSVWQFQISEDPEDPNNSLLRDLTAAGKDQFSFSEFSDSEETGLELQNQGVYKFPSFRMDSTVKAQELEINIGDNLQYLSSLSNSTYQTVVSGNADLNKFQRFAELSRIGSDNKKRADRLTNLSKGVIANPGGGYKAANETLGYDKDAGYNHPNNLTKDYDALGMANDPMLHTWFKYAPAYNKSTQKESGDIQKRPIAFNSSTNGFQYVKTIDLAKAVAEGDDTAINQAAEQLGDGITGDDIRAQFGNPPDPPKEEIPQEPDIPIEVDDATGRIITGYKETEFSKASAETLDAMRNNTGVFADDEPYDPAATKSGTEVYLELSAKGEPILGELYSEYLARIEKEKEKDPVAPPKKIKVESVSIGTEQVKTVYEFSIGKATDLLIEKLSIKEYVRKAIMTKMNGGGSDSKSLVAPFDFVEMTLDIDGIGGIIPGHTFHSDYMPLKYNKRVYASGGVDVGSPVFFMVTEHSQTITDAGWTTQIKGQMCNNPDAQRVLNEMTEKKLAKQFRLNASRSFGIEQAGASTASKIGKFIDVAGTFLVDAKAYIDTNYGNTANGFSLKEYAKNQGIAKAIADAETEEDRNKILESMDIDIEAIGDYKYDGGIFENLAASAAITAGIGVMAGAQVAVGAGTIAYGAGKGIGATAARLDRDPVGIYPEWNLLGKGAQAIKEYKKNNTGKTDKGLLPGGAAVDPKTSPKTDVKDEVSLEKEIANQNDKKEQGKRKDKVAEATGTEIMPLEKLVSLIRYEVINQSSTPAAGGVGINARTEMRGHYKGSPIILSRTQTGEGTLKEVGAINQGYLKQDIANAFKQRYPGNEILLDDSAVKDEAPPAPFLQSTFSDAPFGDREPKWETALACRMELAAKFDNSTYKGYTDEYSKEERLEHWKNAKELYSANPGLYTDSLNAQKVSLTTPQPIMDIY